MSMFENDTESQTFICICIKTIINKYKIDSALAN